MEYISKTGVSFKKGELLTARQLQTLNDKVNELVTVVNNILSGLCDINVEINDYTRSFELQEAVDIVSRTRRMKGMKIRFLGRNNTYLEYSYIGESLDNADWNNLDNWTKLESLVIDGGEFQ